MIEIAFAILTSVCLGGLCYLGREQRRLLREIRKVAELYPPFPIAKDAETEEKLGRTSVHIDNDWNEEAPARD